MKKIAYILLAILSLALCGASHAGTLSGDDAARHYKSNPDKYDGKAVDVDCVMVTRINGGPQVQGVVFFVAHTKDDKNKKRGGGIVVAVAEDHANAFVRKYGDAIEVNRGATEKIDSKRLRGIFRVLDRGYVYIDVAGGGVHDAITANRENAKSKIGRGGAGIPSKGRR